jgi:hypothetical protein
MNIGCFVLTLSWSLTSFVPVYWDLVDQHTKFIHGPPVFKVCYVAGLVAGILGTCRAYLAIPFAGVFIATLAWSGLTMRDQIFVKADVLSWSAILTLAILIVWEIFRGQDLRQNSRPT